jgi:hypothetical protein
MGTSGPSDTKPTGRRCRLIVKREEALDAHLLERDVLRGAKHSHCREVVPCLLPVFEAHWQHGKKRRP